MFNKILFLIKTTIFTFLVFFSFLAFADSDSVEPVIDLIDIPQHYVEHKMKPSATVTIGDDGGIYYKISAKIVPSDNFDLYLLVDKKAKGENTSTHYILCHIEKPIVSGYPYKFTFNSDPNAVSCGQLTNKNFFNSNFDYLVYVSDTPQGQNIARENNFGDGVVNITHVPPMVISDQMGDISLSEITPTEKNGKKFFTIKGEILHSKNGNLHFALLKSFGSEKIKLKTISYKKGAFEFPNKSSLSSIEDLSPGSYTLVIEDDSGKKILTLPIKTKILGESESLVVNNLTETENNSTALVSTDCGYSKTGKIGDFRMCGFQDIMSMLNRIINFIFALVLPIASIVFVYVGFLYLSSASNPNKREIAKKAIGKLVLGIFIIMLAWLLIKVILNTLGVGVGYSFLNMRN